MRSLGLAVLLIQLAPGFARHNTAEPQYQPDQRAVSAVTRAGQACVALDANVLAHAAQQGGSDLRLYEGTEKAQHEVPYALTESSSGFTETDTASVRNEQVHGAVVDFDLRMPDRPWSEIILVTKRKNFMAVAHVTGSDAEAARGKDLGTLTIFDFSAQRLPSSTKLPLAEARFPWVHVSVRFLGGQLAARGAAREDEAFTAAELPPSRQSQVLYMPVARSTVLEAEGAAAAAELRVAAHVPVERVRIELDPHYRADFREAVSVAASPEHTSATERFAGEIGRVVRPVPGPGLPPIRYENLVLPLVLGANLRSPAAVRVVMQGVRGQAVPVRAVVLEMRRRSLCFEALPGRAYTLRYGDAALRAPLYEYARRFEARSDASDLSLGPELRNPAWRPRRPARGIGAMTPEVIGVLVIAVLALTGVLLVERLRKRGLHP